MNRSVGQLPIGGLTREASASSGGIMSRSPGQLPIGGSTREFPASSGGIMSRSPGQLSPDRPRGPDSPPAGNPDDSHRHRRWPPSRRDDHWRDHRWPQPGDRTDGHDGRGDRGDHHHRHVVYFAWMPYFWFYSPYYYWPEDFYGYAPDYYYGPEEAVSTYPTQPYSSAVSPDPLSLGFQYFAQEQYLQAKRYFEQALAASPRDADAYFAYAQALFALGEYRSAADAVRHGLALDPTWPHATVDVRSPYADPSEFTSQLSRLEAYVASHPDNTDARFLLAYNLYFSGQEAQAAQEFSRLAQANPLDRGPELFLQELEQTSGEVGTGGRALPGAMAPNSGAAGY